jgi:hypothetical protein
MLTATIAIDVRLVPEARRFDTVTRPTSSRPMSCRWANPLQVHCAEAKRLDHNAKQSFPSLERSKELHPNCGRTSGLHRKKTFLSDHQISRILECCLAQTFDRTSPRIPPAPAPAAASRPAPARCGPRAARRAWAAPSTRRQGFGSGGEAAGRRMKGSSLPPPILRSTAAGLETRRPESRPSPAPWR